MDMRALSLKAGGPFLTPRRNPPPTWAPLPAAEIGSLAIGPRRGTRQPERWPRLAASASGKKSKGGPDGDEPKNRASSSGNFIL
jgi:hypothetical protein